jgi:predicted ATPase/class 3 adenylate cyclase
MAVLPTGTVTFLFTDIEDSTRLWEEHPDAMKAALARHDELLLSAVEEAGGRVFASSGDGFSAVFQSAGQAVAAALTAQKAVVAADWGGMRLGVRMGLHTGEADERRGDFFGPAVNQTARLMAAGHGGQVLLSAATREVLGRRLPDGVGLRDLGEHRLRDLVGPVQVFQLTHPDLVDGFPPLLSLEVASNNLPVQLTSFVGREDELAEVGKLVAGSRLVTLVGAGGSGKTRLALQAGAQMVDLFPDGVWLVELAPVGDPDLVVSTVGRAVGLPELISTSAGLIEFFRPRRTLLVLDNCEHLLSPVAELVAGSLRAAEGLRVLATSREPLRVAGEVVWPVAPLPFPPPNALFPDLMRSEAVRLFQERAEAASPGFRVTTLNGAAVGLICRLLEGIPLGVELAAARLRLLTPDEIAFHLTESLSVLGSARGDEVPHHRTLQATLDWSYRLLTPREQTLFRRLAVFTGGWTLNAAEATCSDLGIDTAEVLDLLSGLVEKSLVEVAESSGASRYRFLEPVRQHAHQFLASSGEEPVVRERHAVCFARLAEEVFPRLYGPDDVAWLDRLEADIDNLRAALAWHLETGHIPQGQLMAGALHRFWWRSFRDAEALRWLQQMLDADPTPSWGRARALVGISGVVGLGDVTMRAALLDEAIALYRSLGPDDELYASVHNRAHWAAGLGDWRLGESLLREALEWARKKGNEFRISVSATGLARLMLLWQQDLVAAALLAEEGLVAGRRLGSPAAIHISLLAVGGVKEIRGETGAAFAAFEEALEIEKQPRNRILAIGHALLGLAWASHRAGQIEQALDYLRQHHRQVDGLGYGDLEPRIDLEGEALRLRGEIEIARGHHDRGVVMLAADDKHRKGGVLAPLFRKSFEAALDQARQALGGEAFAQAWNQGTAMTTKAAVDYALQDTARRPEPEGPIPEG